MDIFDFFIDCLVFYYIGLFLLRRLVKSILETIQEFNKNDPRKRKLFLTVYIPERDNLQFLYIATGLTIGKMKKDILKQLPAECRKQPIRITLEGYDLLDGSLVCDVLSNGDKLAVLVDQPYPYR